MTVSTVYTPEYINCVINCARLSSNLASYMPNTLPKPAPPVPDLYYPNGCPVLSEGPQKDDL